VTISLMKSENNNGPNTEPCKTPDVTGKNDDVNTLHSIAQVGPNEIYSACSESVLMSTTVHD
jgi:hypothetical protein